MQQTTNKRTWVYSENPFISFVQNDFKVMPCIEIFEGDQITLNSISNKIGWLKGLRGDKRNQAIKDISQDVLKFYRACDTIAISRNTLNSLFVFLDIPERTKRQQVEEILSFMLNSDLVKPDCAITYKTFLRTFSSVSPDNQIRSIEQSRHLNTIFKLQ